MNSPSKNPLFALSNASNVYREIVSVLYAAP